MTEENNIQTPENEQKSTSGPNQSGGNSKTLITVLTMLILILVVGTVWQMFTSRFSDLPPNRPDDFGLIFHYGVTRGNVLNTFDQTFTKDLVLDPSVTVDLNLSNEELDSVYRKLQTLDLFRKNPNTWEFTGITPCTKYQLKIQIDSRQKELNWDYCRWEIREEFQQFSDHLIEIIETKEEYKKLPEPTGGYL